MDDARYYWLIIGVSSLVTVWFFFAVAMHGNRKWFLFKKTLRCELLRKHHPGPLKDVVGGRRIQRCLYCDRTVAEYEVAKGPNSQITQRRIK